MPIDYTAPAGLFLAKRTKNGRENYRRFTTAAEAMLQVGDERFNSSDPTPLRSRRLSVAEA
jgi:hypothetical protein